MTQNQARPAATWHTSGDDTARGRAVRVKLRLPVLAACAASFFFLLAVLAPVSPFGVTRAAAAQGPPTISPTGVGPALVGSTVAQLRSQLGPDYSIDFAGSVLVDVQGYEISKGGDVVFIAAAVTGVDTPGPDEPLTVFIVNDAGPMTAAGIQVGSTVTDGVNAYGTVTVSFNVNSESREFANFASQPDGLVFGTGVGGDAGIYPTSSDEFQETTNVKPKAPIKSIWVQCRAGIDCPPQAPPLPYTGRAHTGLLTVSTMCIVAGFGLIGFEQRSRRSTGQNS